MLRLVILSLAAAVSLAAQTKQEILALDQAWYTAILKKDTATLEKLLAPDLVYAHASGVVDTKKTYIEKISGGKQVYASFEQKNVTVNLYGTTAVTHSWARVTGVNPQGKFDDKIMMLHVWVQRGGAWLLAGHQTTRVDKLP
jgi:ketosteroid isomerase-like protein